MFTVICDGIPVRCEKPDEAVELIRCMSNGKSRDRQPSLDQLVLLRQLKARGALHASQIEEYVNATKGVVWGALKKAKKDGFVIQEDTGAKWRLTPKGKKQLRLLS